MPKEIYENIYLNEIDLPNNPLKYLNSYIIIAENKTLIIDTGFNRPECQESFYNGIEKLNIDLTKTDILVTHLHSDHCGLINELEQKGANILLGAIEAQAILALDTAEYWETFSENAKMFDLTKFSVEISDHPGYKFRPKKIANYQLLHAGDTYKIGNYNFQVMLIPGHTKGHIALYEPKHKLLFSSDLILDKITATITFWDFEQDILQVYFDTLKKVELLDINLVLTGHRSLITDHKQRIAELIDHHQKRLTEIKDILTAGGEQSVADVAGKMTWDIKAKSWADFPKAQKWFATGEAMAHLEHLYCMQQINRTQKDGKLLYNIK